jgi:SanA protein
MRKLLRYAFYTALLVACALLAINLFVYHVGSKYIVDEQSLADLVQSEEDASGATALLLGASVYSDGRLSPLLEERAKRAIELYESHMVKTILVSGDSRSKQYNEVEPIREYLLDAGVPSADILLDYAGYNTFESVRRAQEEFGITELVVVTQRFHLPRALFVAQGLGVAARGVPAASGQVSFKNYFREFFAVPKTFWEVGVEGGITF